jgi:hypothetical protein
MLPPTKQKVNIGFRNFITSKFPKEDTIQNNRETMLELEHEQSSSARHLLNGGNNKDSNRIFDNQQIISVEDEYETKKSY